MAEAGSRFRLGYWLSSEEHPPNDLVRFAARAEEAGFDIAGISDHFHPWVSEQGQSAFVWSVLGGVAHAIEKLRVVTGVTCPIIRMHPAIVAHAAATAAVMFDGRFSLGVGTGERLNEHVTGAHWPGPQQRREMLEEAIEVIRRLWSGGRITHVGKHYSFEDAQLFTVPAKAPAIIVAGSSPASARLAGRAGDGFFGVAPSPRHVEIFEANGGRGKPRFAQIHVCWAKSKQEAADVVRRWWPNAALKGAVLTELKHPREFEQVLSLARPADIGGTIALGPDAKDHLDLIARFVTAGFDHVLVHQIGRDQEGFLRFYADEILPALAERSAARATA